MKIFQKKIFSNLYAGEVIVLASVLATAAVLIFPLITFSGVQGDALLYINSAQFLEGSGSILNRYTHIYLQKLFLMITADPMEAATVFWTVQVFCTALFVYLCSKLLNPNNTALTGCFALLFFFAQRAIYTGAGAPTADLTVMLLSAIGLFLYLVYLRAASKPHLILSALGFLQILLLKSKETGIIFLPFLLASVYLSGEDWRTRLRGTAHAIFGVVFGIFLFFLLDGLFLADPLFSFRLSNWQQLLSYNLNQIFELSNSSWYDTIFTTAILLPLLFSIFVVLEDKENEYQWPQRLLWAYLPFHILFLTVAGFRTSFPMSFRNLFPSIAVISIVGAQFFFFRTRQNYRLLPFVIAGSILLSGLMVTYFYPFMSTLPYRWTTQTFFSNIVTGISFSIILLILLIPKSARTNRNLLLLPLVVLLASTPIFRIPYELTAARERSEAAFSPFQIYADRISNPSGSRLFVTQAPYAEYGLLCPDSGTCEYLFEAFFNTSVAKVDFSDSIEEMLFSVYDYAFVSRQEYLSSTLDDDLAQKGFIVFNDFRTEVILLVHVE